MHDTTKLGESISINLDTDAWYNKVGRVYFNKFRHLCKIQQSWESLFLRKYAQGGGISQQLNYVGWGGGISQQLSTLHLINF